MEARPAYYDKRWMGTFLGEIVEFHAPTRVAFKVGPAGPAPFIDLAWA